MPRKSPVAILASLDFAEKPFRTGGSLEKTLKRMRGQNSGGEEPVAGTAAQHPGS